MANNIASLLIVTIVICVSQGFAQRCSLQQCAELLNSVSRRFPKGEPLDSQNCEENTPPGESFIEPDYSNQGFNRPPNRIIKDSKNPLHDWMKDWDRLASPFSPLNRREDEVFEENGKNSYEEEIQYDEPVPMFDSERMDTYPFQKPYPRSADSNPESSLYPALDGVMPDSPRYDRSPSTLDKSGRRNSESLRQRSFRSNRPQTFRSNRPFPSQIRQVGNTIDKINRF